MAYIVYTTEGNFREWIDEARPPYPGDPIMTADNGCELVEIVAEGPEARPLHEYYEAFLAEVASIKRGLLN